MYHENLFLDQKTLSKNFKVPLLCHCLEQDQIVCCIKAHKLKVPLKQIVFEFVSYNLSKYDRESLKFPYNSDGTLLYVHSLIFEPNELVFHCVDHRVKFLDLNS